MKIAKGHLGLLLVLAIVLVGGGYLLSPKFTVARSVNIGAAPQAVYALVADPLAWKRWSMWNQRDPAMAMTYGGAPSGVGAVWEWKSATEGDSRMRFTDAQPGQRLAYELYFPDFGTTSQGDFRLEASGALTRVTWTMNGDMGANPLFHWMALMADGMVGKDLPAWPA